jgi:hypothetical protein
METIPKTMQAALLTGAGVMHAQGPLQDLWSSSTCAPSTSRT